MDSTSAGCREGLPIVLFYFVRVYQQTTTRTRVKTSKTGRGSLIKKAGDYNLRKQKHKTHVNPPSPPPPPTHPTPSTTWFDLFALFPRRKSAHGRPAWQIARQGEDECRFSEVCARCASECGSDLESGATVVRQASIPTCMRCPEGADTSSRGPWRGACALQAFLQFVFFFLFKARLWGGALIIVVTCGCGTCRCCFFVCVLIDVFCDCEENLISPDGTSWCGTRNRR